MASQPPGPPPWTGDWSAGPPQSPPATWPATASEPPKPLVERLPAAAAGRVLLAAAAAGLFAQLLFVEQRLGINLLLWVAAVLAATFVLRRPGSRVDRADAWIAPAALAFAAFVALRDDLPLRAFDVLAAGILTLAAAVAAGGTPLTRRSWAGLANVAEWALALVIGGALRLGAGWAPLGRLRDRDTRLVPVLRGLIVAVPLAIVFAALFAAADAVFAGYLERTLDVRLDVPDLIVRLAVAGLAAWLTAGFVVGAWLSRPAVPADERAAGRPLTIGTIEALVVLLAIDAVFAVFVVLQAAYLFGGLDTLAISGMTYSEYARRGFFELIAVALLAGTVVLTIDWLIERRGWAYRASAAALVALTAVVLVSAVVRLGLYQAAYGWTELRLYALAAIGWLGVGVAAAVVSLLVDRAAIVPRLLVGAGIAIALVVNAVGPQAFVTDQNVQRAIDPSLVAPGGESGLDLDYLGFLGYDSVPVLVDALPRLSDDDRAAADRVLRRQAARIAVESRELGWPSWSVAGQRASDALVAAGYLVAGE